MEKIFARVCMRCREYIKYQNNSDYEKINMKIHSFDLDHEYHTLVTINLKKFETLEDFEDVSFFYDKIKEHCLVA
ncbi:MAG: hypothetical protein GY870_15945 [archaeon]|nr:hypothetical protein [archaeon]